MYSYLINLPVVKKNNSNASSKTNKQINPLYKFLITEQSQKLRPFGQTEERFRWELNLNNHITNANDHLLKINRVKRTDSLDGGFDRFYNNSNKILESRPISAKRRFSFDNNSMAKQKSQRVLLPFLNTEPDIFKLKRKRTHQSADRNLHSTTGGIALLLEKTPLSIKVKGKKRINCSYDNETNPITTFSRRRIIDIQPARYINKPPVFQGDEKDNTTEKRYFCKLIKNKNTPFLF